MPFRIFGKDISNSKLPEEMLRSIARYIEKNYVDDRTMDDSDYLTLKEEKFLGRNHRDWDYCNRSDTLGSNLPCLSLDEADDIDLVDFLKQIDAGFTQTLLKLIDNTGKKDSDIYKKANISKQHFSKIRSNPNYKPTKPIAIALALALELDLDETCDLIGRAGYALTNSSKFDLIIRYFIEHRNYNVVEINIALYKFDQPLLGS